MPISYSDYLKLDRLLALQDGIAPPEGGLAAAPGAPAAQAPFGPPLARDELLFITVHQVDELWFKLVLRELEQARDLFKRDYVPETSLGAATRGLRRVARAFELAADHFALIETMTPRDFLDFRDKLLPASGFQSPQFREIEILLGLAESERLALGNEASFLLALDPGPGGNRWALERVQARRADRPTFKAALEQWVWRAPIDGSQPTDAGDDVAVERFITAFLAAHEQEVALQMRHAATQHAGTLSKERYLSEIEAARTFLRPADPFRRRIRAATLFIESYRELPLLAWPREILDLVIQMEQSLLVFRQRHARMVERLIGKRVGTGGSTGVDYLDETALRYRVFGDMWAVRTFLLRRDAVPPLSNERFYYDFRGCDAAS